MRLVLTGARVTPAMLPDLDLRDSYFGGCDLSGLDLSGFDCTSLSILDSNVTGLRLPDGAVDVYMRRTQGEPAERAVLDPLVHDEITALFLRRARIAPPQVRPLAETIGRWVAGSYRTSWRPGWARFSRLLEETLTDEGVKFVCADHPELLAHWESIKALPKDESLIPDDDLVIGNVRVNAALAAQLTPSPDRVVVAEALQAHLEASYRGPRTLPFGVHVFSLEPFVLRVAITDDPDFWRKGLFGP